MGSPKNESYDVSPKMRAILEFKQQRRLQLREQYLRETLHPTKQLLFIDTAANRYANMVQLNDYRLKMDGRRYGIMSLLIFGSILLLGRVLQVSKEAQEKKIRSGLVAYADKEFKCM